MRTIALVIKKAVDGKAQRRHHWIGLTRQGKKVLLVDADS